jgi:hypothetical protein
MLHRMDRQTWTGPRSLPVCFSIDLRRLVDAADVLPYRRVHRLSALGIG